MRIITHSADRFRNLKEAYLEADSSINIIYGENGQGKTNIIESMWLFTGCYSFRTHKNARLICDGERSASAECNFFAAGRSQNARLKVEKNKDIILNGVPCSSPREMLGKFSAVVFSPATLSVVQDGPGERRKLIDVALSLMKPNYASVMSKYLRAVNQRNALLKKINEKNLDPLYLDPWDAALAKGGALIIKYRLDYLKRLREASAQIYEGISSARESFDLCYSFCKNEPELDTDEIEKRLSKQLLDSREGDLRRLYTQLGPHADDLILTLNGKDAREYGSQGQQRSCALALKLSEASIIGEISGETPVVLLDDVMSELDEGRQRFILNYLDRWQVFITCCDPSTLLRSENGKIFEVKNGQVFNR